MKKNANQFSICIRADWCSFAAKKQNTGSALVLAVVATAMLFIIGSVFLLSSRTYKTTVAYREEAVVQEDAVRAVINRINTVLVEDLVGTTAVDPALNLLNSSPAAPDADETWDYPYTNPTTIGQNDDYWLASLEPEYVDLGGTMEYYYWRHITDLWGDRFGTLNVGQYYFDPEPRTNPDPATWNSAQWKIVPPQLSDYYKWYSAANACTVNGPSTPPYGPTIARIITDQDRIDTIIENGAWDNPAEVLPWGGRGDADGDGVADSRWVRIPDVKGPKGQNCYTAVRIIDNGGMININTAFRDPTLAEAKNWDGSLLTHINLDYQDTGGREFWGIRASTEDALQNAGWLQQVRCGGTPNILEADYFADVARRILYPDNSVRLYQPFDLSEELEMRNRFFLTSPVNTRMGYTAWPVSFEPGITVVGRDEPFNPGELEIWYDKATSSLSPNYDGWTPDTKSIYNYNRRGISTTYNFDRIIVPKNIIDSAAWTALPMPDELKRAWQAWNHWELAANTSWAYKPVCINDIVSNPNFILDAGPPVATNIHLLAAAFWLSLPNTNPYGFTQTIPGTGYGTWALTRDDIACQLAVNLVDYIDGAGAAGSTLLTSTPTGGVPIHTYYGYESTADMLYISEIAMSEYDNAGTPEYCCAIELYNPPSATAAIDVQGWIIDIDGTPLTIANSYTINPGAVGVIADTTDPIAVPSTAFSTVHLNVAGLDFSTATRVTIIRPTDNYPVDSVELNIPTFTTSGSGTYDTQYLARGSWFLNDLIPVWDTTATWAAGDDLNNFTPDGGVYPEFRSRIKATNRDDGNFENIAGIFSIFGVGSSNDGVIYRTAPEWLNAYRTGADLTSLADGKIEAGHSDFRNLLQFITVNNFNPFSDTVDNDGRNGPDPGDERELEIAGRININTAPWFVIAQLPWIQDPLLPVDDPEKFKLAHAIVAYRDRLNLSGPPFYFTGASAGTPPNYIDRTAIAGTGIAWVPAGPGFTCVNELANVTNTSANNYYDMRRYGSNMSGAIPVNDNAIGSGNPEPFYNEDNMSNDLDEQNIFLQRISNLATVRSDVFTAYIAVRVGEAGPVRRFIAIFDRTNVFTAADTPKLVALQPVADPR